MSTRQNVKTKPYGNWDRKEYWAGRPGNWDRKEYWASRPIEDGSTWLQALLVQVLWKLWSQGIFIVENGVTC